MNKTEFMVARLIPTLRNGLQYVTEHTRRVKNYPSLEIWLPYE